MYIYIRTVVGLYAVGFYDPDGKFQQESDHVTISAAAERVRYLNGGSK